ncbi:hypothetical protein SDC9_184528 [bioreactor metagenome]|uniref:Uncharacterized protein n=1 Tax=bioreactor metagenome TaxID=1076179 RepID=A0A645HEP0_9ZZZZ
MGDHLRHQALALAGGIHRQAAQRIAVEGAGGDQLFILIEPCRVVQVRVKGQPFPVEQFAHILQAALVPGGNACDLRHAAPPPAFF